MFKIDNLKKNHGTLHIICGPMFSGKTEELIKRLKRAEIAQLKTIAFKHKLDDRMTIEYINSHSGEKFKAIALENAEDIKLFISEDTNVIGIDEIQFFNTNIIKIILELIENKKHVIAAGLNLDFRAMPFGCISHLLTFADSVTKLTAVCNKCGDDAIFTQRLIEDRIARFDEPIISIGAQDKYQARCRSCFVIDNEKYWPKIQNL